MRKLISYLVFIYHKLYFKVIVNIIRSLRTAAFYRHLFVRLSLLTKRDNYSRLIKLISRLFTREYLIHRPGILWKNHILKFILTNKEGLLGTFALHLILIIVFLMIKIQTLTKLPETGIIFELESEMIEIPSIIQNRFNENNTHRRNIAVNQMEDETGNIEDYSENYSFNEVEIEHLVRNNIQKVFDEVHDKNIPEFNNLAVPVIYQAEEQVIKPVRDSTKTYKGPTNIYYSLEDRNLVYLAVPVYKCEEGGTITVEIKVNQNGNVIFVKIKSGNAINNQCLVIAARNAAFRTRFNPDVNAPLRQSGFVSYQFVAQ